MNLKDKTILVTGASSGIGEAVALASAKRGAVVLINYRNNEKGAKKTLSQVQEYSKGFLFRADLEKEVQIKKMFSQISDKVGKVDALVNNAGEHEGGGIFDNKVWESQFQNIFFTALHVSQEFLKQNKKSELRKIVNVSSIYGTLGHAKPTSVAYSIAKTAMNGLTVAMAKMFANVSVNAVAPGYTWTPAWDGTVGQEKKMFEKRALINRFVAAEEIGEAVVSLLENDAITGQILTVDGGVTIPRFGTK